MRKRCGRSGVGKVVRRYIYRLNRGDRAVFGGRYALLQRSHFVGEGGLISNGRGHSAKQGGNFRACLNKSEDIVYE